MQSTLTNRREEDYGTVSLPFGSTNQIAAKRTASAQRARARAASAHGTAHNTGRPITISGLPMHVGPYSPRHAAPQILPQATPKTKGRKIPLVVRANRALRTVLVALCGTAILGYGLDVAASNDVSKLQEQARRLNEQNTELSAQLLKAISFQGIQDSVLGRFGLRVPEQVIVAREVPPPAMRTFKPTKHHLPIMSGY